MPSTVGVPPGSNLDLKLPLTAAVPALPSQKLQKELSRALDALRYDRLEQAQIYLNAAFKIDPANANVDYARGLLADRLDDPSGAQSWWKKSIELQPSYTLAMLALGRFFIRQGDLDSAEAYLQKALSFAPNSWRTYALLAVVRLSRGSYSEAATFAEQSLTLGKSEANPARLPLAEALIALDDRDAAQAVLTAFIKGKPPQEPLAIAQQLLRSLRSAPGSLVTDSTYIAPGSVPAGAKFHFYELPLAPIGYPSWIPPGVDDSMPPVADGVSCPVQEVLDGAARNVQLFVKSVEHFTATEALDHELVDDWGLSSREEKRRFNYVVDISEPRRGFLSVQEYRNGTDDLAQFPDGIATIGLPSFVLLFHPYYRDDYEVTCEGLGRWRNSEAWQLHFIQRPGKPSLRTFRSGVAGPSFSIALKGRVWIDKQTLQVVRMESDLVAPLSDIKLTAEHQDIEFAPVKFRNLKDALWLPASADIYFELHGRKFRRLNTFSDYLLFSVDDKQKISAPKESAAANDTPASQSDTAKP